jgi:tetratricopeptide (TPR) repeat protein
LGNAYLAIDDYDQAIATYKKSLETSPHDAFLQFGLVAAYSLADRQQEARDAAAEFIKFHPDFSLERIARRMPYKNTADTDRIIKALRTAGLK